MTDSGTYYMAKGADGFLHAAQEANRAARPVSFKSGKVLRPRHPGTATVHSFLRHVRASGVSGVPEPLGIDGNREVLRYVEGASARDAWYHQHSIGGLQSAARLLRAVHDASRTWTPPPGTPRDPPIDPRTVVDDDDLVYCHGDPGPWNFIWRDNEAVALIDWDLLHLGSRLSDVAYALHWFVPMRADELALHWHHFPEVPDRRARAVKFLEAYGGLSSEFDVVDEVCARIRVTQASIRARANRGDEPHRSWVSQGVLEQWQADIDWTAEHRSTFRKP